MPPRRSPLTRIVHRLLINVRDFIYPPLCIVCDEPLDGADPWLCGGCRGKLRRNHAQRDACPLCGENRSRRPCACDLVWDHPFQRICALFDFDDTVRAIAHQVKYKGRSALARHVARTHAPLIPPDVFAGVDVVVPVPLYCVRRLKRGYNQAEVIARGILEGLGGSIACDTRILRRRRHTTTQTKLDREQRRKNLDGAFVVAAGTAERLAGKTIALVDDVVTTGSTTSVCTEVLLGAGAAAVRVVALARG
jgi:ComF family protein